jgi:hypothetical protein
MKHAHKLGWEADIIPRGAAIDRRVNQAVMRRRQYQIPDGRNDPDYLGVAPEWSCSVPRRESALSGNRDHQCSREKQQTNRELPDECNPIRHQ